MEKNGGFLLFFLFFSKMKKKSSLESAQMYSPGHSTGKELFLDWPQGWPLLNIVSVMGSQEGTLYDS